jgi:hypothetical protein
MEMPTRGEAERRIRERVLSDADFRAQLKEDPRAALEAEFGIPIPSDLSVEVHQESMTRASPGRTGNTGRALRRRGRELAGGDCYLDCPQDMGP